MKICGALAKGCSNAIIYFCKYCHSPIEKDKIQELINAAAYDKELIGDTIEILAIESKDELKDDMQLVGLIFKNEIEHTHTCILLDEHADLSVYLREIVE